MALITVTVDGDRRLAARIGAMSESVRRAVERKIRVLTLELQRKVKMEHLSGPTGPHSLSVGKNTPNHTGGQLRASLRQEVAVSPVGVVGTVGFSADTPYAAIHEFGGTINIPEIVPVKAKILHWVSGGKDVFARRVAAHTVTIPERAPLRTGFAEMKEDIREGIKDAVKEGLRDAS